ncbi:MAG: DUF2484 family protein [Rhodobacteraceae bacterium]|nr:DUF2484 family protein [Paracoccaceae bacterium]
MSLSLTLAAVWVVIATVTAMLPMRRQFVLGFGLLLAAPVLIVYIGIQHGIWISVLGLLAFVSMFRKPLYYLGRRALGHRAELPPEFRERMK